MARVIIIHADDGLPIAQQAQAQIVASGERVEVSFQAQLPEQWDNVLALFALSPQGMTDPKLAAYADQLAHLGFQMVPIVADLQTFDFRTIPAALNALQLRNAVGVSPADVDRLLEAVRGYLGLESFLRDRKVFISYRRSDASLAAEAVYDYLWTQKCAAFLDKWQLPGGALVQAEIMQELHDKDFVLFIDSPDARTSPWIDAELSEAVIQRIPVGVLRLEPGRVYTDLASNSPSTDWEPQDPHNLSRVLRLVSRGIAARSTFDTRIDRTIRALADERQLQLQPGGVPRRLSLTRAGQTVRIEWEDAGVSLERLHRLFQWYTAPPPSLIGIYVSGDRPLPPLTRQAVDWARGMNKLQVIPLEELEGELERYFPSGPPMPAAS